MSALLARTLFDDIFKDVPPSYFVRPVQGDRVQNPDQIRLDVQESGPDYIVNADIPGVRREDIDVSIDGNKVTLSAVFRPDDRKIEDSKVLHSERHSGTVTRAFRLPSEIDQTTAKARYQDGVLTLTLPKASARNTRLVIE